ncbi:hypothetical protein NUW54_g2526 [Trametes sanguinea]|uniref:Uncharacterized protein n=1 Tax=Trametes sanguinea TaxID=158606 RepID=A0ACC1Q4L2_9APHY|nr:hypothetical protein NUW54_g2526 [Trametes sanguinea]
MEEEGMREDVVAWRCCVDEEPDVPESEASTAPSRHPAPRWLRGIPFWAESLPLWANPDPRYRTPPSAGPAKPTGAHASCERLGRHIDESRQCMSHGSTSVEEATVCKPKIARHECFDDVAHAGWDVTLTLPDTNSAPVLWEDPEP